MISAGTIKEVTVTTGTTVDQADGSNSTPNSTSFVEYLSSETGYDTNPKNIVLTAENIVEHSADAELHNTYQESNTTAVIINDTASATWYVEVPKDGLYVIAIHYISATDHSGTLEQVLKIDGTVPFKEASYFSYKRTWKDATDIQVDLDGNDLKPSSQEVYVWNTQEVSDPSGYVQHPFTYALSAGSHNLTLQGQSGAVAIDTITLQAAVEAPSYADVLAGYQQAGYTAADAEAIIVEGENTLNKSDVTIYPISDRTSPATYPQSPSVLKLNTIGGSKWKQSGQWITWEIKVPVDGLYQIAPRFKQSLVDGTYVSRSLRIDGKIPFAEAESLKFEYQSNWQCKALGNDKDGAYLFYLTAGETHTLTLEVCLGDVSEYLGQVQTSLTNLNSIYRSILMISGSVPDTNRDYSFDRLIPDSLVQMEAEYNRLCTVAKAITDESGQGSFVSIINKLTFELKNMYENPRTIAKNLTQFKSNLGSLATWLLTSCEQPLTIDRFYVLSPKDNVPQADNNFVSQFIFGVQCFMSSFINDYNHIGQSAVFNSGKEITVWMQSGRDQATILRQLIDNKFSTVYNIKVNLQLVAGGSLLPSVLAGTGPDVSLGNGMGDPINFAIRNANFDLSQFGDFNQVIQRFCAESLVPYTFKGKTYALPETLTFPMFFYRTDIFENLGLSVPTTWNEMMALIPLLQQNNMSMAFPTGQTGYSLVLYKNGGDLYQNEGESTNLDSDVALNSFQEFSELFTLWKLPVSYNFPNRFRTGEMPCGVVDYTVYNILIAYAPEIKGLWNFIPVPGVKDENGVVQSISVASGTNVMMMRGCNDSASAWEFIKWWTSTEAQSIFAIEMESTLGAAAKQPTANVDALTQMSWTSKDANNIISQLKSVKGIPEVPGGYYTSRIIDFAFSKVYNNLDNPAEVLGDYIDELNEELTRKRAEFGM